MPVPVRPQEPSHRPACPPFLPHSSSRSLRTFHRSGLTVRPNRRILHSQCKQQRASRLIIASDRSGQKTRMAPPCLPGGFNTFAGVQGPPASGPASLLLRALAKRNLLYSQQARAPHPATPGACAVPATCGDPCAHFQ